MCVLLISIDMPVDYLPSIGIKFLNKNIQPNGIVWSK